MKILSGTLITGIIMTTALTGYTKSYDSFCFQEHIRESIAINKERKQVYAELTGGRSNKIFNLLISYEYLSLAPATYFDLQALSYQKNGMDLFCHEFMSMVRAPEFNPEDEVIPREKFKPFDWQFYKNRINEALKHQNLSEVKKTSVEALLELKSQPNYYCFSRHLIESIYRFAHFVPLRANQAQEMELKDPTDLMFKVMKLHLLGLKDSYRIDHWAQPIQMNGTPILCSEIPDLLFDLDVPELKELKKKED